MGEHAKYGGSTIKRTAECPAWVEFCAPLPKSSSDYADEGTLCHNAMQRIFSEPVGFNAREVIGSKYKDIVLTQELYAEKIFPAIEAVEDIFEIYDIQDFVCEKKVVISEDIWGRGDLLGSGTITIDGETLRVGLSLDYKFGSGVMVSAYEPQPETEKAPAEPILVDQTPEDILSVGNQQGLFYAVAASATPETQHLFQGIDLLVVAIVQPNDRGIPDYTLWEVDGQLIPHARQRILNFCDIAEKTVIWDDHGEIILPNDAFKPGDHCLFCDGDGHCPPTSGALAAMRRLDVTAPHLIKNIPTYDEIKRAQRTCKVLLEFIHEQITEGVGIPGFKLVPKQARRSYVDLPAAELVAKKSRKLKREEAYKSELHSPTQLEKVCKSKGIDFEALFGSLVQKVSSGTTLASSDDSREATPGIGALQSLLDRG